MMKPKGFFREHGELFIGHRVQIYPWEVVADIEESLAYPLLVFDYPGIYKFTRVLWRV